MSKVINYRLLLSSSGLKIAVAMLQFIVSILYMRHLGAVEYGKILAFVASTEIFLLLTLPGVQKTCLKILATDKFPVNAYILKVSLLSIVVLASLFLSNSFFYLSIALLMCVESLNTLNRASLSIKKKFNLLISLDLIRPGLSVIIISGTLYFGFIVEKEIYLFVLFVSVLAEVLICLPFVILELGKNQWEQFKISPLFKDSLLASGFSYTSTSMRKLPVVVAGSILPELSALTSIFLQFFTLINYLISSLMMQISVSL